MRENCHDVAPSNDIGCISTMRCWLNRAKEYNALQKVRISRLRKSHQILTWSGQNGFVNFIPMRGDLKSKQSLIGTEIGKMISPHKIVGQSISADSRLDSINLV